MAEGVVVQAGLMPHRPAAVAAPRSSFAGFRFPPEVIMLAVRWYLRYGLSYRDVEDLLAERGIVVDHVTIYRWVQRFTPELIDAARPSRHVAGDRWFVDETYLKLAGRWVYLYRAIDCCPSSILQTKPSLKMRTFIAGFVGVVTACSPR